MISNQNMISYFHSTYNQQRTKIGSTMRTHPYKSKVFNFLEIEVEKILAKAECSLQNMIGK